MTKFLGYSRKQGISKKSNNEYDFYILSFSSNADTSFIGEYVFQESVSPTVIADAGLDEKSLATKLGFECNLSYFKTGNKLICSRLEFK